MEKMKTDKFKKLRITRNVFTIALAIVLSFTFAVTSEAATFTVTKIADTDDGTCDSDCSLREAIEAARLAPTDDVIEFSSLFDTPQTIVLNGTRLFFNNAGIITINGKGARKLFISGNNQSRVFELLDSTVTFNDLTIQNGKTTSFGGGVIVSFHSSATFNRCTIRNNESDRVGAGINGGGSVVINDSTISGNIANDNSQDPGGGIWSTGSLTIKNSTISGNSSPNTSGDGAGGIYKLGGTATIVNSTITNNTSLRGSGGIQVGLAAVVNISNSIVAGNTNTNQPNRDDVRGSFNSQGYNLIGKSIAGGFTDGVNGDQVGSTTSPIDPMLFPLADNGGPTMTHAPSINSPVIDKGSAVTLPIPPPISNTSKFFDSKSNYNLANLMMPLTNDQRGMSRPQDIAFIANAVGGDGSDIGAFEALAPTSAGVSVSGKVVTNGKGRGISRTIVQMTDMSGNIRTARTNQFGYFRFEDVQAGETYVFNVYSRRYQFAPQVINVSESLEELIFKPSETTNRKSERKKFAKQIK